MKKLFLVLCLSSLSLCSYSQVKELSFNEINDLTIKNGRLASTNVILNKRVNELTKEIVYGWVTSSMGIETYNSVTASLIQKIENQINPPIIIQQAPWM